jgi:hypothetical protein
LQLELTLQAPALLREHAALVPMPMRNCGHCGDTITSLLLLTLRASFMVCVMFIEKGHNFLIGKGHTSC